MKKWFFYIFFLAPSICLSQNALTDSLQRNGPAHFSQQQRPSYKTRKLLTGSLSAGIYGGSFLLLNEAWYKGYDRSGFHTFNDIGEWQQVDKLGHAWSVYHTSRAGSGAWRWAGVSDNKAVLLGTSSGLAYLLAIEYLDGRSAEWGWSWGDAGADIFGAALFAAQQLTWKEQKISIKFSSHYKNYEAGELKRRADGLFGASLPERLLKDYNAQSYWLSANISSILPEAKVPAWLNIAIGYGAGGMYGGYENTAVDKNGNVTFSRPDLPRFRQWYLSPDIDLTRIRTGSRFLRSAFSVLNIIKIPAPALELSQGKLKARWLR